MELPFVKVGVSGSLKKRNAPGQGSNVWTSLMGQSPISIPVMYSNGYIPAHGKEDNRNNPWVLATQSGYKEIWNNKIQTNISLEQKLDFITMLLLKIQHKLVIKPFFLLKLFWENNLIVSLQWILKILVVYQNMKLIKYLKYF